MSSQSVQAGLSRPRLEVQWFGGSDRRDSRSTAEPGLVLVLTAALVVGTVVDNADVVVGLDCEVTAAASIVNVTARSATDGFMSCQRRLIDGMTD